MKMFLSCLILTLSLSAQASTEISCAGMDSIWHASVKNNDLVFMKMGFYNKERLLVGSSVERKIYPKIFIAKTKSYKLILSLQSCIDTFGDVHTHTGRLMGTDKVGCDTYQH